MTPRRRKKFLLAFCLGSAWLTFVARAAVPANGTPPGVAATNFPPIPAASTLRSPVDLFRQLLAMTPLERRQSLTNRPVEVQKQILAKLREYQLLKPEEQELRLRATELQWYLLPLMSVPRTNRAVRLSLIPEEPRKLVEDRLNRWDQLPASVREEMLNNEMTARYFGQLQTETNRETVLGRISPERRAKLEAGIDRWRGLTEEKREQTLEGFNAFFQLTPREKQQALSTVSEAEQKQMEKTLQAYEKLSPAQRLLCIRSFEKFAGMSLADRQAFLKNAERWKLMSPTERAAWRKLVTYAPLMPPMPARPAQMPPMPPTPGRAASESVATNQN